MNRPLRFCMITTFYPPYNFGGDGIFVQRLTNLLAHQGHQVEVIHCCDAYRMLSGREPTETYEDHPNVTVHGLKSRLGPLSPLATHQTGAPWFKSSRIRQILAKGFDVIHYHNISLVGGPKILQYGTGLKFFTAHDYWPVCPTHTLFKFNHAPCTRPLCLACTLSYRRPPQWWRYSSLLQVALHHIDALLVPTQFSRKTFRQRGFRLPITHLPFFVPAAEQDLPTFEAALGGPAPKKPYFFFVGRLEKLKGLQTLIPLFQQYQKAQLLIAGTGNYEPFLQKLAEGHPQIRFLGHLNDLQLQAVCREAIALLVPSLNFELIPLVIPEAFRLKAPAVVRNLGGMPEIIQESGGGFVYDNNRELLSLMNLLLDNADLKSKLGNSAYETYQRKWSPDAHLKQYLSLIHAYTYRKCWEK